MEMERGELPLTPRKHAELQNNPVPLSPDMKFARNRLDNLLSGIRSGDGPSALIYREDNYKILNVEEEEVRRGPGRPRKPRREKRVVFELRGKSFGIRDVEQSESIYSLCRKWMYGKDDEIQPPVELPPPLPNNISLDLMATKTIYSLPAPAQHVPVAPNCPDVPEFISQFDDHTAKEQDPEVLLAEHLQHYKNVKQCFNEHKERRRERYKKSIELLRTVHKIAQQTQ
ncbi:hypothetical protein M3Y94_00822600 [Aphelenchoides besseyi]|nr:hypothetical protein M3Y94_00822600 [Aphelenchoides besseyi]KAI6227100.1 hypothetical protein M3Y95_00691100 [Aphelenchoides besseyi]